MRYSDKWTRHRVIGLGFVYTAIVVAATLPWGYSIPLFLLGYGVYSLDYRLKAKS